MANSLLKRLLGEALEDPVEHHLSTIGAGVPPAGRQYPEMPPPQLSAAIANEEKRELQIARRMKTLASQSWGNSRNMPEGRAIRADIEALADELIQMHTQKPPA